jgi:hypothetical protein
MKRVATLVLNRNLPDVTNRLCEHLRRFDGDLTDIFVIEAGSDDQMLSKYVTWHAIWPEAREHGLRYSRGMNYGLSQLWREGRFEQYDAFFLLTNDSEFEPVASIQGLLSILDSHPRLGILSPCSKRWGERLLMRDRPVKYFWFIHNNAYLMRREFLEKIYSVENPGPLEFVFDGENFRGYGSESELIAKAYANDWAAGIARDIIVEENESHLLKSAASIKTEEYSENLRLYLEEGRRWMRRKYGFNSRWSMQQYVKAFYDKFFEFHPEFECWKV